MTDIVNLRQVRKQKARTEKQQVAEQNRALHGRTLAERERDRESKEKAEAFVSGHRLDRADIAGKD